MFETLIGLISNPVVHTLVGVVAGWLALPMPGSVANSFWGKILAPIFGVQGSSNLAEVIAVIMSMLKLNGTVAVSEPAPNAKMVHRVMLGKVRLQDAADNHQAVKMAAMMKKG